MVTPKFIAVEIIRNKDRTGSNETEKVVISININYILYWQEEEYYHLICDGKPAQGLLFLNDGGENGYAIANIHAFKQQLGVE